MGVSLSFADSTFMGKTKSDIELFLCSDDGSKVSLGKSNIESTLESLKFYEKKPYTAEFTGKLVIPLFDIEYIDLRCDFYTISIIEHDPHYIFRQNKKDQSLKRHLFYSSLESDKPNKKELSTEPLGNLYEDDSSNDTELTPIYKSNSKLKKKLLTGDKCSITAVSLAYKLIPPYHYSICNNITGLPVHRSTSCAYSAERNQFVYYIRGSYEDGAYKNGFAGTFNGTDFVEFEPANKTKFIDNHQIAFYYIDLGG